MKDLNHKEEIERRLEQATQYRDAAIRLVTALESQLDGSKGEEEARDLLANLSQVGIEEATIVHSGLYPNAERKTNVRVYEEIIRDAGMPLHATLIAEEAQRRGVVPVGKYRPARLVRNALANSKFFENVGSNTWRMRDLPRPDLNEEENAHDSQTKVPLCLDLPPN